jgi:hypothetical protein
MTDEYDMNIEAQDLVDDVAAEPSIWGQKSDIDWLGPATRVSEYDEMLNADCEGCDLTLDEEDTSELGI